MKKFNEWNEVKKETEHTVEKVYFKERDIFWTRVGENIGYEQNGKGDEFQRPILVVKKYTNDMFLGVPLSTTIREGSFYFQFMLDDKISTALLVQHKLYSNKRLMKKMGMINKCDFDNLKMKLHNLIFGEDFCSSVKKSDPEGNCKNNYTTNFTNKSRGANV